MARFFELQELAGRISNGHAKVRPSLKLRLGVGRQPKPCVASLDSGLLGRIGIAGLRADEPPSLIDLKARTCKAIWVLSIGGKKLRPR